jgi:hypothetical protein
MRSARFCRPAVGRGAPAPRCRRRRATRGQGRRRA